LKVEVGTGRIAARFQVPVSGSDWGYVGTLGKALFGSEQARGASYLAARTGRGDKGNLLGRGDNRHIITSRALFRMNRHTGTVSWRYAPPETVIANATICADSTGLYFFESTAADAVAAVDSRVKLADFTAGRAARLVCLDSATGSVIWKRTADLPCAHVLHLACAGGTVLASGCTTREDRYWYHVRTFRARDGRPMWARDIDSGFAARDWAHGKQDKQPLIIGNTVYYKQGSFDLHTGKSLGFTFATSNCAESSASAKHIFCRSHGVATLYDLGGKSRQRPLCSTMRPGCYTSIIGAGGIVMMPAASAGCTCPQSIQTTIAWEAK